jgi:hypothetical protein
MHMSTAPRQRGYPLGALFVLVTVSGVLIAGITPLVQLASHGEAELIPLLIAAVCGMVAGGLTGIVVGIHHFRRMLGAGLGLMAGIIIGGAAGIIALLPESRVLAAATAIVAGSGLVVGVALMMRRTES